MTLTVSLPEDVAARLEAEAVRRGVTVDVLIAALAAELPEAGDNPLEEFIGSGSSGRGDLGRRHREIRPETTGGLAASDL